jgi:1,4-dihydroxy-2-naphthoate octaprenyltransferase
MANNLRDIPTDTVAGKRTLAVRLGAHRSRLFLVATIVAALLLPSVGALVRSLPWLTLLTLITLPLAIAPLRVVRAAEGRALVPALIGITRLSLAFGVVLAGTLLAS